MPIWSEILFWVFTVLIVVGVIWRRGLNKMIFGWLLGLAVGLWLLHVSATILHETYEHKGGGLVPVWVRSGHEREVAYMRWGTEDEYKDEYYVGGAILLVVGASICWVVVRRGPLSGCN